MNYLLIMLSRQPKALNSKNTLLTFKVVERFQNQGDTTKHLEELQSDAERQIDQLKERKEKLQTEFEEMKYSGEAKLSR